MRTAILCGLLFLHTPTYAGFYDGNALVKQMREWEKAERHDPQTNYFDNGAFSGYVTAVYDVYETRICPAGRVSLRQVGAVVQKYLNDNPALWGTSAHELVRTALTRAFPC